MAVWVVRAGRQGEFEEFAISNGVAGISFGLEQPITDFQDREDLLDHQRGIKPGSVSERALGKYASQQWHFVHDLQVGDTLVLPRKQPKVVAVGKLSGPYRYQPDLEYPHVRPVEWDAVDIPRPSFDPDLLSSFGALSTVFQVNRTNAQERIDQVVRRYRGEVIADIPVTVDLTDDADIVVDWDEVISDYVARRIRQKFTGHRLEYLVESILKAEGYTTLQTRRGADGGIDVIAGKGEMGFEEPRLCVQVKSGASAVDVEVYRGLQGSLRNVGANHGLLVSLGDFTRAVRNENERSFFQIRLWGPVELVRNLLNTYDKLPTDIRADIPLVDRKVPPPGTDDL